MKKLFAVLTALTLILSMGILAFAADDGTITITNAVEDAKYEVYQMLTFVPSNEDATTGVYKVDAKWKPFFESAPATNYFTLTGDIVALKNGVTEVDQTLAKAAIAYAEDENNNITATATKTAEGDTVTFTGLPYGYYAIDTSLGTLCSLTNINSLFTTVEKNEKPDIDKFVQEDSLVTEGNEKTSGWGKINDADIGQTVNFKAIITIGTGATNYIMHDKMDAGLTFNKDVTVEYKGALVDTNNYTVAVNPADGHTFDVIFDEDYIAGLKKGDELVVYYSAVLNDDAIIVDDGNDNTVKLSYGENSSIETIEHKTETYTWKMEVLKYTTEENSEEKIPLAGAIFEIINKTTGTAVKFTDVTEENGVPTYMVDPNGTVTTIETNDNGKFVILGLDSDSYALNEIEAPAGYNKLTAPQDVLIETTESKTSYTIDKAEPATIGVLNSTGSLLPETGGIGTTIFYVVGGLLMVAALVILVSKRRMKSFA